MKSTHHDHKTLHIDTLKQAVHELMTTDEHTEAIVCRFETQDAIASRPEGFASRNRRRAAFEAENN